MFRRAKVAVFVDGCFWHACPLHGTTPKTRTQWWTEKLDANSARDRETDELLSANGWLPIHIWEHEDPVAASVRIAEAVGLRTPPQAARPSAGEGDGP